MQAVPSSEAASKTEELIKETTKAADLVASLPPSFKNTVDGLALLHARFSNKAYCLTFPSLVASTPAARDIARECKKRLEEFELGLFSRQDLYKALCDVKSNDPPRGVEESRVLQKYLWDFENNGLGLPDDKRQRLIQIKSRIGELCTKFNTNVNETRLTATFTAEELEGVGDDYLQSLEKTPSNHYIVSTHYPQLFPVLQRAQVESTRQTMERLANTKCVGVNEEVLAEVLLLRQEAAEMMGFANDAALQLANKMAGNSENVNRFLEEMAKGLEELAKNEYAALLELKKLECEKRGKDFANKLNAWDTRYYVTQRLKRDFNVDEQRTQQYFPLPAVLEGLCSLYQQILGIKFKEISKPDNTWHEEVLKYAVNDASSDRFLGHFYLDLFPRDGKYSHAACFPLQLAYTDDAGIRHPTESVLVCNFTRPLPNKPSLLRHSEVVTLFHEVGHLMHSLLSSSRYSRLCWTWTAVEQDFLEVPSMMFENFAWDPSVLRRVSRHWQSGEPLPDDVIAAMIKSRHADAGMYWRRLIGMSMVDMTLHSSVEYRCKTSEVYSERMERLMWIKMTEGTNPVASWQHLTTGYNAGYYGYLWSLVYACDLFSIFKEKGIYDQEVGAKFRRLVLEPVAIYPGKDMLVNFLGRSPDPRAFLRAVGALP